MRQESLRISGASTKLGITVLVVLFGRRVDLDSGNIRLEIAKVSYDLRDAECPSLVIYTTKTESAACQRETPGN